MQFHQVVLIFNPATYAFENLPYGMGLVKLFIPNIILSPNMGIASVAKRVRLLLRKNNTLYCHERID